MIINTAWSFGLPDTPELSKDVMIIHDMPLVIGINYFHCLKVLELLKVAEGDQKSLFGQYTSQRVKVM